MIIQIIFAAIFFGLGAWFGYNKSQEKFGDLMMEGKAMFKSPVFGWFGHPDAFDEIKKQEDKLNMEDAAFLKGVTKKVTKIIRKNKK